MIDKNKEKVSVLNTLSLNGFDLRHCPKIYQDDFDCVLTAVKDEGLALNYASDRLKDNEEIVLAALTDNGFEERRGISPMFFASERLVNNLAFCIQCAKLDPDAVKAFKKEVANIFALNDNNVGKVQAYLAQQEQNKALLSKLTEFQPPIKTHLLFKRAVL